MPESMARLVRVAFEGGDGRAAEVAHGVAAVLAQDGVGAVLLGGSLTTVSQIVKVHGSGRCRVICIASIRHAAAL